MDAITDSYTLSRAEQLKEALDAGIMAYAADMFPLCGNRELLNLIERRALGLRLMDWHSGGGSGVYAVGSTLFAGHEPDEASIERAGHELMRGDQAERAMYAEMISTLRTVGLLPRRAR